MKMKKVLAAVLAGTMVMGSVVAVSAATELTGTSWWDWTALDDTHTLEGDGALAFTVECTADADSYAAFTIQLFDSAGTYLSISSDGGTDGTVDYFANSENGSVIVSGVTYTVTITRADGSFVVDMHDDTNNADFFTTTLTDTLEDTITIRQIAQVGTFVFTDTDVLAEDDGDDSNNDDSNNNNSSNDDSNNDDDTDNNDTNNNSSDDDSSDVNTQGGDAAPIAATVVALLGCAAIVVASKKKMA